MKNFIGSILAFFALLLLGALNIAPIILAIIAAGNA